jgi:hypothetical protein
LQPSRGDIETYNVAAACAHHLLQAENIDPECVVHISLLRVMSFKNHRSPGSSSGSRHKTITAGAAADTAEIKS